MAYKTYTTEAIVCGSKAHNTSDKSFLLFTKDAGMVYAVARSVREERSKQRYAMQDFSVIRSSLVRGKSGWRIGSVENESNPFTSAPSREARTGIVRMVKLLRQFVYGEEPQASLFDDVRDGLYATKVLPQPAIARMTDIFALRLLHKLGYVASDATFQEFLESTEWTHTTTPLPASAERAITEALQVSHL